MAKPRRKTKKRSRAELERELQKAKAELKKAKAKKKPRKSRAKKAPVKGDVKQYKSRIGKTTHVTAKDIAEGEPQYTWKELEELAAPLLVRGKKGDKKRWARLVVEMSPNSLLRPDQYRHLRGKPVIRSLWTPPEELVGRAAKIVDQLQRSEAITPRMKIVLVESKKRPPRKLF